MTTPRMKTAALFLSIATLHGVALAALPLGGARAQDMAPASNEPATLPVTFHGVFVGA
ncbi:MAG: hypothetical protein Q7J28_00280 [Caulobacter sp.]|nr:hypothetical protein [Caulobacter sp.]